MNKAEYYKNEWYLSRESNDGKQDKWKELYRQQIYTELQRPFNIWHDSLPYYKFIYLN